MPNFHALLRTIAYINLSLLIFNMLPIYPLDGGRDPSLPCSGLSWDAPAA
jgi:hypothetical protein